MQLLEKYKEDISSDGVTSDVRRRAFARKEKSIFIFWSFEGHFLETSKFSLYFSGNWIPTGNKSLFILLALPTLAQTIREKSSS
jgi:hypothetical protein